MGGKKFVQKSLIRKPLRLGTAIATMGISEALRANKDFRNVAAGVGSAAGAIIGGIYGGPAGAAAGAALGGSAVQMAGGASGKTTRKTALFSGIGGGTLGLGASMMGGAAATGGGMGLLGGTGAASGAGGGAMASSGAMSMLGKVALGTSVISVLGQAFNKPANMNFDEWKNALEASDREYVDKLQAELTQIQSDINTRNAAVSKLIDDFPNVMAQEIAKERSAVGKAYDETTKIVLDNASNQLAAKYAAAGGFSSGAFNQALGKQATDVALARAGAELSIGQKEAQIPLQQYQMRLAETEALRDFQQTMLTGQTSARNSAVQNALNRQAGMAQAEMGVRAQEQATKSQNKNALFGSLGQLAGTALMSGMLKSPAVGSTADPNAGFATLRNAGLASRAPGGVNQYAPWTPNPEGGF